ncbi:hypothetical protein TARUN_5022 [Trichoderma arundinaceum]|uniref:Uncharacterized protein n=1 Tax=Trichoderma arundinaceum TaxID=490622 RepID=A0A395NMS1_TRIAR|nr:hypothetical protein TARUN_5022 [Trichoderma arundinaceum]
MDAGESNLAISGLYNGKSQDEVLKPWHMYPVPAAPYPVLRTSTPGASPLPAPDWPDATRLRLLTCARRSQTASRTAPLVRRSAVEGLAMASRRCHWPPCRSSPARQQRVAACEWCIEPAGNAPWAGAGAGAGAVAHLRSPSLPLSSLPRASAGALTTKPVTGR